MEQEIIPMSRHLKIGTVSWGALAGGKLSRTRENPTAGKRQLVLTDAEFKIQDEVVAIAKEIGRTPSQVAVNWILQKSTSPLLGCRTLEQLEDNLGALEFELTPQQIARLDEVSKDSPAKLFPHNFLGTDTKSTTFLHLPNPVDKKYDFDSRLY